MGAHSLKCGAQTVAVGGTTPRSSNRNKEKPGSGPLGWPSDEYIQLSGGAAAGAAAGAVAGAAVAISSAGALLMAEQRSSAGPRAATQSVTRWYGAPGQSKVEFGKKTGLATHTH